MSRRCTRECRRTLREPIRVRAGGDEAMWPTTCGIWMCSSSLDRERRHDNGGVGMHLVTVTTRPEVEIGPWCATVSVVHPMDRRAGPCRALDDKRSRGFAIESQRRIELISPSRKRLSTRPSVYGPVLGIRRHRGRHTKSGGQGQMCCPFVLTPRGSTQAPSHRPLISVCAGGRPGRSPKGVVGVGREPNRIGLRDPHSRGFVS